MDEEQQNLHTHFETGMLLANPAFCEQFLRWNTYYRRNMHRFATGHLGIPLYPYQQLLVYLAGDFTNIVAVCARLSAKSFTAAVIVACICILYPHSRAVITSKNIDQANLILSEKLIGELATRYTALKREIKNIRLSKDDTQIVFKNGSTARCVVFGKRGYRSTINIIDEAREVDKKTLDEVCGPYKMVRQPEFLSLPAYAANPRLFVEEPRDLLLSSSIDDNHWLFTTAKKTAQSMFNGDQSVLFCTDYSVTLRHGLRSFEQMKHEKEDSDALTWMVEYENRVLRNREDSYFKYQTLRESQTLFDCFYPKNDSLRRKVAQRQPGEVRILSCDIAAIDATGNDCSAFTLLRVLPAEESNIYDVQVSFIERSKGYELRKQAVRIRQLMEDFDADYLVLDVAGVGQGVYQALAKVLPDEDRHKEYRPLCSMNNEKLLSVPGAEPIVFTVYGSAKLNSDIAVNCSMFFSEGFVKLLVPFAEAEGQLRKFLAKEKLLDDVEATLFYESPFRATQQLVSEMANLRYDRGASSGVVRLVERPSETKDCYSSLSYGLWLVKLLAEDSAFDGETWKDIPKAPVFGTLVF